MNDWAAALVIGLLILVVVYLHKVSVGIWWVEKRINELLALLREGR